MQTGPENVTVEHDQLYQTPGLDYSRRDQTASGGYNMMGQHMNNQTANVRSTSAQNPIGNYGYDHNSSMG